MSYVTVSAAIVKARAQRELENIKNARAKMLKEAIDARIESSKNSWLRRLFRFSVLTPEEALQQLKEDNHGFFSSYDLIRVTFGQREERLELLLQAVQISPGKITLSVKDVNALGL